MTARFLRLGSTVSNSTIADRRPQRAATRNRITKSIAIELVTGERATALLQDFSAHGCNVRCNADWLRLGRFVVVRLSETASVQAVVRWLRDGSCGIEFLRPMNHDQAQVLIAGMDCD
jgi:hypothetical protein